MLVIRDIVQENVAPDGAAAELKPVLYFDRATKGMVLNRTNADALEAMFGDDIEAMHGQSVELFVDPTVMFQGQRVSGLRLRAPGTATAQPVHTMSQADVNQETAVAGDDIPF